MGFDKLRIIQPSLLTGERAEPRAGEKIGEVIGNLFLWIPGLKKYRPISGEKVAKAMIQSSIDQNPMQIVVYGLETLHQLSSTYK